MSQENTSSYLEAPEERDRKENKSPALSDHSTTASPWVCRTGRDKGPFMPPEHYINRISRKTGNHDMDFIRRCYDEDYPIVDPDATSDCDRRGMPHGHDRLGNPFWYGGRAPAGVKRENMTAAMLAPPPAASHRAPWQQPGVDSCALQRAAGDGRHGTTQAAASSAASDGLSAQGGPAGAPFDGDACAWERSHIS